VPQSDDTDHKDAVRFVPAPYKTSEDFCSLPVLQRTPAGFLSAGSNSSVLPLAASLSTGHDEFKKCGHQQWRVVHVYYCPTLMSPTYDDKYITPLIHTYQILTSTIFIHIGLLG
jgi:hypothetical protein